MSEDRHAHEWVRVEGAEGIRAWACTDCDETSATCGTCHRASGSSLLLCARCEKEARRVLDDIDAALAHYESAARYPLPSPGDMRLVPLHGAGRIGISTPADIEGELLSWVARWTEYAGPSNASAADYLRGHHMWAAHHPEESGWLRYLRAMRSLRCQARRIAGLLPKRLPEPCVHCGGQVVQDWADRWWQPLETGLSDVVRCTGCGTTWGDSAHWLFSTRQHIVDTPVERPDALVTLAQARMIWPDVPAATMRQWAKRARDEWEAGVGAVWAWWHARQAHEAGEFEPWAALGWTPGMLSRSPMLPNVMLPERGSRRGETVYRVGDLHALALRWADERRPGRRALVRA